MRNHGGFTLVELIIVILLLGILSATVIPRFLDISNKAMESVILQVEGAIRSFSSIANVQAYLEGVEDGQIQIDGHNVDIRSGYARGHWNRAWRFGLDIGRDIGFTNRNSQCTVNDLCGVGNQSSAPGLPFATGGVNGLMLIWPEGYRLSDRCYAYYFNAEDGSDPLIGSLTSGCS